MNEFKQPRFHSKQPSPLQTIAGATLLAMTVYSSAWAKAQFIDVAPEKSGMDFVHPLIEDHPLVRLYHTGYAVGGICLGDVNGDGLLDVYLVNGPGENTLYMGKGDLSFEPIEAGSWAGAEQWGIGASLVDIDNDGDLDLYQCNYDAPNELFLNDGKGVFAKVEGACGLDVQDSPMQAAFADVDNDGDLDMFLLCNRLYRAGGRPQQPPFVMKDGQPVVKKEFERYYQLRTRPDGGFLMDTYGRADYLFLNDGAGEDGLPRFRDISREAGVAQTGSGLSCIWWDYDMDGDLDLYVANDFLLPDRLYRNDGPDGDGIPQFTDVVERLPSITWSSMGSDFGDINNDGLPDLFAVDMSATTHLMAKINMGEMSGPQRVVLENSWPRQAMRNHLFINAGQGYFQETARAAGVSSTDWSWASKLGDFDNDGWVDLFIANGVVRNWTDSDYNIRIGKKNEALIGHTSWDLFRDQPTMPERNLIFQNIEGRKFKKRNDWGLGFLGMSYGAVTGDLDNDGDLDLIVSDLGERIRLFENTEESANALRVKLLGTKSNRMGIGARVVVTDNSGQERTRWLAPWTGFQSQNDMTLHVGLGEATPTKVDVYWPSGTKQTVSVKPDAGEIKVVEKGTGKVAKKVIHREFDVRFGEVAEELGLDFIHKDVLFDDFKAQPLLPGRHSQLGPCLAVGDVDGDGDDDLFIGGAANQSGAVYLQDGGRFSRWDTGIFDGAAQAMEDLGAVWFDVDGDGDQDLYVASGSVEFPKGDPRYRNRLYLNKTADGEPIKLVVAPAGSMPDHFDSSSCVVPGDYDGDGDLDLFVGSRLVPGEYPISPASRLLRNDSKAGKVAFVEAAPEVAPSLKECGLVTDAAWVDLEGDGDLDLVVSVEWGAVKIFANDGKGKLAEVSETAGTGEKLGWWSCVEPIDVDGDGDLDLVSGNAGWNTKYKHPSPEKLQRLYYGDMEGSGKPHLVEAKPAKEEGYLPVRGLSCSSSAMPFIKEKLPTYRSFASCNLTGIYSDEKLAEAQVFEANDLASGVWMNESKDGEIQFRWLELPWEVQLSPVNAAIAANFGGKKGQTLVLAQNHYTREPETGLWRGNPGCHLEWNGDGFAVIPHRETGLYLPNDTKALKLIQMGQGKPSIVAGQNDDRLLLYRKVGIAK